MRLSRFTESMCPRRDLHPSKQNERARKSLAKLDESLNTFCAAWLCGDALTSNRMITFFVTGGRQLPDRVQSGLRCGTGRRLVGLAACGIALFPALLEDQARIVSACQ